MSTTTILLLLLLLSLLSLLLLLLLLVLLVQLNASGLDYNYLKLVWIRPVTGTTEQKLIHLLANGNISLLPHPSYLPSVPYFLTYT